MLEEGSKRVYTLMSEDHITLVFKTRKQMHFGLGDYITHPTYGRFEITKIQKPKFNSELRVYEYSLQFNAEYYKWANKKYKFEPSSARQESTFCLTDSIDKHMSILVRNLKSYGWEFVWSYDGGGSEDILEVPKYITYDNVSILDALGKIAEAYEVEWWVTDKTIHLGRVEIGYKGEPTVFEVGKNVDNISDAKDIVDDYFNVFTAFGSDKNIPSNYRSTEEQIVVNGVVQHRLMLPADTPLIYLDGVSPTDAVEKKVEGIVVFDDVYPRTNGEIASVETYKANAEDTDPTTGEEVTVEATFYRFKDKTLTFDESYILPGKNLSVTFKSGLLNGMTFEVWFNPKGVDKTHSDYQLFEIVRNDTYGLDLPNDSLKPIAGDEYNLIGFDATKLKDLGLIDSAEQELKERALNFAKKRQIDPNNYTCEMLADYMYGRDTDGHLDKNFAKTFSLGDKIRLVDGNLFDVGYRDSRVIGFEYDLVQPYNNAKVVVGENATYSRSSYMEGEINAKFENITFNGSSVGTGVGGVGTSIYIITSNDTTAPKDTNVLSALRSNNQFLRKDINNTASGLITFLQGLVSEGIISAKQGVEIGEFVTGLYTGTGAAIDEKGNAEVESLRVRSYLEVMELIINRLSAIEGDQILTEADTIETVDDLGDGLYRLKLKEKWEGYFTAQVVGNVVKGIINTLASGSGVYYTSWMLVKDVDTATNQIIVQTYPDEDTPAGRNFPPCELMKIARWGNVADEKRQSCLYFSSSDNRILRLSRVTKPIIDIGNYGFILGELPEWFYDPEQKLPINKNGDAIYVKTLVYQNAVKMNYQGKPEATIVDRGNWMENPEEPYHFEAINAQTGVYETSDVWYRGCKWRCIKDCPTGAPRYDSMEWFMIEGNPDFSISIEVENGGMLDYDWFAAHGTDLVVTGQIHNQDVTADILDKDVSWTRRSKDAEGNWRVSDDEAWNALLRKGKTLHLTVDDISYNSSGLPQMLEFTATALLRDGVTAQDTISVM